MTAVLVAGATTLALLLLTTVPTADAQSTRPNRNCTLQQIADCGSTLATLNPCGGDRVDPGWNPTTCCFTNCRPVVVEARPCTTPLADIPVCAPGDVPKRDENDCPTCRLPLCRRNNCTREAVRQCWETNSPIRRCQPGERPVRLPNCCPSCVPKRQCSEDDLFRCRRVILPSLDPCGANESPRWNYTSCCLTCRPPAPPQQQGPTAGCVCTPEKIEACRRNVRHCLPGERPLDLNPLNGQAEFCCPHCIPPPLKECAARDENEQGPAVPPRDDRCPPDVEEADTVEGESAPVCERPPLEPSECTPGCGADEVCVTRGRPENRTSECRTRRCLVRRLRVLACRRGWDARDVREFLLNLVRRWCSRPCNERRCFFLRQHLREILVRLVDENGADRAEDASVACPPAGAGGQPGPVDVRFRLCVGEFTQSDLFNETRFRDGENQWPSLSKRQFDFDQLDSILDDAMSEASTEYGSDFAVDSATGETTTGGGSGEPTTSAATAQAAAAAAAVTALLAIVALVLA